MCLVNCSNPYPAGDIRAVQDLDTRIAELKAATVQQAKDFHGEYFGATNAELVLVGAFDAAQARQQIEKAFGDWKTIQPYEPIRYRHFDLPASRQVVSTPDKKSATYVADMPVPVGEAHNDFVALQIASMGLSKRLLVRVRQEQGLSYGVSSWLQVHPYDDASHWRIYASFAPQNLAKVEAAVADELKVFNDKGLSDTEVQEAVTQWLEGEKQARADDKSLAYLLGDNLDKDRDFSWQASQEEQVKRLTAAQVNRVIATYCQPDKWPRVIAGDWVPPQ